MAPFLYLGSKKQLNKSGYTLLYSTTDLLKTREKTLSVSVKHLGIQSETSYTLIHFISFFLGEEELENNLNCILRNLIFKHEEENNNSCDQDSGVIRNT